MPVCLAEMGMIFVSDACINSDTTTERSEEFLPEEETAKMLGRGSIA